MNPQALEIYSVPVFFLVGFLVLMAALLPTKRVAGHLMVAVQAASALEIVRKRQVSRTDLMTYTLIGFLGGLGVGLVLLGLLGVQGLAVGLALALCCAALPYAIYQDGWDKKWVQQINGQTLRCLRTVYMFSGMGGSPVEQSLRVFAQTWAGRSALAELLLECPQSEDPIAFLSSVPVPGQPYTVMVMALQQAQIASADQREAILRQAVQMALSDMTNWLKMLAKKKAMTAIIVAVMILLPTLLLAVLAPPASSLIGVIKF